MLGIIQDNKRRVGRLGQCQSRPQLPLGLYHAAKGTPEDQLSVDSASKATRDARETSSISTKRKRADYGRILRVELINHEIRRISSTPYNEFLRIHNQVGN